MVAHRNNKRGELQCALGYDQAVGVVVDVRETYAVGARAEDVDAASAACFQNVGEEEVVAGAVAVSV